MQKPDTLRSDTSPLNRRGLECEALFPGLPAGASRGDLFRLIRDIGRSIGLSARQGQHLEYLLRHTSDRDWEPDGLGPIVYKSVTQTAAETGVSERQVHRLEKRLHELGCIAWRDRGDFHRFGQRDGDNVLRFAYGVDLSPLAHRFEELADLDRRRRSELAAFRSARETCCRLRRRIRARLLAADALGLDVDALDAAHATLPRLTATMTADGHRRALEAGHELHQRLDTLLEAHAASTVARHHAERETEPAETRNDAPDASAGSADELSPEACGQRPKRSDASDKGVRRIQTTNNLHAFKNATGNRDVPGDGREVTPIPRQREAPANNAAAKNTGSPPPLPETGARHIPPGQALEAAGEDFHFQLYLTGPKIVESSFVEAAEARRRDLGISRPAWREACRAMGRYAAAIAVLVIDRNLDHPETPIRSPGGVLRAMTRRAPSGNLHLHRSIHGILERDRRPEASA